MIEETNLEGQRRFILFYNEDTFIVIHCHVLKHKGLKTKLWLSPFLLFWKTEWLTLPPM